MGTPRQRPSTRGEQLGEAWAAAPGRVQTCSSSQPGSEGRPGEAALPLPCAPGAAEGRGALRDGWAGGQECQALDRPEDGDGTEVGAPGGRAAAVSPSPVGPTVTVGRGHHVDGALGAGVRPSSSTRCPPPARDSQTGAAGRGGGRQKAPWPLPPRRGVLTSPGQGLGEQSTESQEACEAGGCGCAGRGHRGDGTDGRGPGLWGGRSRTGRRMAQVGHWSTVLLPSSRCVPTPTQQRRDAWWARTGLSQPTEPSGRAHPAQGCSGCRWQGGCTSPSCPRVRVCTADRRGWRSPEPRWLKPSPQPPGAPGCPSGSGDRPSGSSASRALWLQTCHRKPDRQYATATGQTARAPRERRC